MNEIWRPVPSMPGVESSNLGRIRSTWGNQPLRIKKARRFKNGYLGVSFGSVARIQRYVHSLVCEAFHGNRPTGMECAHIDGDCSNNREDNLKWATPQENNNHKREHGTLLFGERQPRAKLTNIQARLIWLSPAPHKRLAQRYGVSRQAIGDIKSGKRWASVTGVRLRRRCGLDK